MNRAAKRGREYFRAGQGRYTGNSVIIQPSKVVHLSAVILQAPVKDGFRIIRRILNGAFSQTRVYDDDGPDPAFIEIKPLLFSVIDVCHETSINHSILIHNFTTLNKISDNIEMTCKKLLCPLLFFAFLIGSLPLNGQEVLRGEVRIELEPIYGFFVDEKYPLDTEPAYRRALE
jgi:hypothetical protein